MKKLLILASILINFCSPASSAGLSFELVMSNYHDYITDIYTCGRWEYGEKEGYYRVIHVDFLYGCSWLYIQWMKGLCCDGTTQVLNTLSLYNNDHHENTFDRPVCTESTEGIILRYTAKNGHDNKKRSIELSVFHQFGKHFIKQTLVPEN